MELWVKSAPQLEWSRSHGVVKPIALLSLAASLAATLMTVTPAQATAPALNWSDCGEGFQCATAEVPLDHRRPNGTKISLPVVRKPAIDQANRIGSLFIQSNEMGLSVVDNVRATAGIGNTAKLNARFDLVGVERRGVEGSSDLSCQTVAEHDAAWAQASTRPVAGQFERAVKHAKDFNAACVREKGDLLPHMGTEAVARDMDLVRAAIGEGKVSFLGGGYGSYVGTVYANLFPKRLRATAFEGGLDGEAYANRPYDHDRSLFVALDGALERFFAWCKRTPETCAFGAGNPKGAFIALQKELDRNPVGAANGYVLTRAVAFWLNSTAAGYPVMSEQLVEAQQRRGWFLEVASEGDASFYASNAAVECSDRKYPRDLSSLRRHLAVSAALAPVTGTAMAYSPPAYEHGLAAACAQWPVKQLSRYAGPFDAKGSAPILVVGIIGDPHIPYEGSVALASTLSNARLLTRDHDSGRACARKAVVDYLFDGELPAKGTVCRD